MNSCDWSAFGLLIRVCLSSRVVPGEDLFGVFGLIRNKWVIMCLYYVVGVEYGSICVSTFVTDIDRRPIKPLKTVIFLYAS